MKIESYKPKCCGVGWYVKSRADYRCKGCNKDVTLEIVLIAEAVDKSNKNE